MRAWLVFIPIGIVLSGCLPPVIVIANYASDGILLATTGKTKTEHFLSGVAKKDCSTFRVVQGKEICQEWKEGHEPPEVVLGPGSDVTPPLQANARTAPVTTTAQAVPPARTPAPQVAAAPPTNAVVQTQPPAAVVVAPPAKNQTPTAKIAAAPPAPVAAKGGDEVVQVVDADHPRILDHMVVLGTVRAQAGAQNLATRYREIAADARVETVDGRQWRVVSGPYVEYEAFNMRDALRDGGLASANVAPCGGKCGVPAQATRPADAKPAKKQGQQTKRAPPAKGQIAVNQ